MSLNFPFLLCVGYPIWRYDDIHDDWMFFETTKPATYGRSDYVYVAQGSRILRNFPYGRDYAVFRLPLSAYPYTLISVPI